MFAGTEPRGPVIRALPKSRYSAQDEARAVLAVMDAARGTDVPLPIFHGPQSKLLGWVCAPDQRRPDDVAFMRGPEAELTDVLECAITKYDDFKTAIDAGQIWRSEFHKTFSGTGQGRVWYDLWPCGGDPVAGTYPGTALTARGLDDTAVGAIGHGGNVSAKIKYLTSMRVLQNMSTLAAPFCLYDRVATYEACTINGAQQTFVQTGGVPARYNADGIGLKISVTAQTALGATASNMTELTYVNTGGASHLVPQDVVPAIATSVAVPSATVGAAVCCPNNSTVPSNSAASPYMPMATGDYGAKTLTTFTTSASNTGTLCFALVRPLGWMTVAPASNYGFVWTERNFYPPQSCVMKRVYDGACLSVFYFNCGSAAAQGRFRFGADFVWS